MIDRARHADFCTKPFIFADSQFLPEIAAFGGCRKPQKTGDFRRKPQDLGRSPRGEMAQNAKEYWIGASFSVFDHCWVIFPLSGRAQFSNVHKAPLPCIAIP